MICPPPSTIRYADTPPNWMTIDVPGNRFIADAGVFAGVTQSAANTKALKALRDYKLFHQKLRDVQCVMPPPEFPSGDLEAESDEVL